MDLFGSADLSEEENVINNAYRKNNLFCVYMLRCLNPKYKSKIYIGFTTNPARRLEQHNKGRWSGGAKKTTCKGPWDMVVIVHRFPNKIAALAFEWAWQHPDKSRRMRNFEIRRPREPQFDYYCRALEELLSVGPWNKFPLEISWCNLDYMKPASNRVPKHMPWQVDNEIFSLNTSLIEKQIKKKKYKETDFDYSNRFCLLCVNAVSFEEKIMCLNGNCGEVFHIICLAESFSVDNELLPVEGSCPNCEERMLWGNLIRKRRDLVGA